MAMRDSHRMFLQGFMSHGILIARDVRKLYKTSCARFNEPHPDEGLAEFVKVINAAIKPIHLEIRKAISEDTGSHCYGLVNTRESEITKLASDYTVNELEFFKKMIEAIVESDTGTISTIDSLNLVHQVDKMAKKEAEFLLKKLERENWLNKNAEGVYSLSPRSLLELEQYLFDQYPESTVQCNMCKRICVQGQDCTECPVKLHKHCANTYFNKMEIKRCPGQNCNQCWIHETGTSSKNKGVLLF
ncbi:hypothetical protein LSH36_25g03061 [Paralvinella palmiformis]|uniref:Non-structural maintenance of chromosomes element 1 homolog n=1 Tax=Paralvinella palmiformis TaxID=53620 RepID=A0AAD9NHT8_9ANNE|nr:hypothetical protein LSH36_25g03061 [Paralvinella palmiformis]